MPTYEYECGDCLQVLEIFQSFSESPKTNCPQCGKNGLRRLISRGIGVVFKGSGFYVTDNRPKKETSMRSSRQSTDASSQSKEKSITSVDSSLGVKKKEKKTEVS